MQKCRILHWFPTLGDPFKIPLDAFFAYHGAIAEMQSEERGEVDPMRAAQKEQEQKLKQMRKSRRR